MKNITIKIVKIFSGLMILFSLCGSSFAIFAKLNSEKKADIQQKIMTEKKNNIHHKTEKKIPLKASGSEKSPLWSNAFNFQKSWGTQVDPRTGILMAYIKTGSMISNLGHGPNIDLEVNYSSSSLADPDGLGQGWSFNLTHFNPVNNQLSTSQGKVYNLQQKSNGEWWPQYHKLKDIHIGGNKSDGFVITYANGLREELNRDGYETRLEQQNGYGVHFSYIKGTHLLSEISDDQDHKIVLNRAANFLTITSYDSEGKPLNIDVESADGELQRIILPGYRRHKTYNIHMNYIGHLLTAAVYPTGLKKSISYNCHDAMKAPPWSNNQPKSLCVVTRESVYPGANQPEIVTGYRYGDSSANEHNYLAFNSGLDIEPGSGQDILFETPASYTYKTIQDNGITQQIRIYNKYHLLIKAQIVSDTTNHLLSQVQNFFCRTDRDDGCAHTRFEDLPENYSLPLKTVVENWGDSSGLPAKEVTERTYDSRGRVTSIKDAYGRVKKISYCPAGGDESCPAEPSDWSLSTEVESVISYPSEQVSGASRLPKITENNSYRKEFNTNGHGYILVLAQKVIRSGDQKITTTNQYYNNLQNTFEYGLIKQVTVKTDASPTTISASASKDYYYILSADHKTKTVYNATEIGKNQFRRSPAVTTSMYTNQVLKVADAENNNISYYHYDGSGRIVQTDSGVGTAFMVSKHYQYIISPQRVELITVDANGLKQKILFNGMGKKLAIFNQAIADNGKMEAGQWMLVKRVSYDAYGRISSKHVYHYDAAGKLSILTTTFEYDDMGRVYKVHSSDKETVVKIYDDPDRCAVSYKYDSHNNYSPISVVHGNVLEKPIEQMVLPANFNHHLSAKQLCEVSSKMPSAKVSFISYDGFGRVSVSTDTMGRKVSREYDDAGHIATTIDPAGDKINNIYNLTGQVVQEWALPVNSHGQYLMASAQYDGAGELLWKAGEDGKKTQYTYTPDGQVATIITPSGHVISWKYNVIGLPVNKMIDGRQIAHLDYDPVMTVPVKRTDITGITTWSYSDDEKTQQLVHTGSNGYQNYQFKWQYNKNRKMVSVTDLSGNKIVTSYDIFGRIDSINYQTTTGEKKLLQAFGYDDFSRVVVLKYGSGMHRTIDYDNYGQKESVTDMLSGNLLSVWRYNYDKAGNIISLIHSDGNQQQATKYYQYDKLDNLISMTCSGSAGLPLCPRDTSFYGAGLNQAPVITRQKYSFNALNRMTRIQETLLNPDQQETLNKTIDYDYTDAKAPLRLQKMAITWNNKTPVTTDLSYDDAGNMLADGEGNKITYNALNQITSVTDPEGRQVHYFYDGSGREIRENSSTGESRNLFYMGKILAGERISNAQMEMHTISHLGVAKAIDGMIHEYYEKNYKGDVTALLTKTTSGVYSLSQQNVYSPYGMVWHTHPTASLPWYLQTHTGFDSEQADPFTGWQFLGAGHRTYNPQQRYFVSEDPAGDGYAFGSNNPVMNSDPGGNMPKWLAPVMHALSYVGTLGMAAFHKKWANAIGVAAMTALTCATVVAGLIFFQAGEPLIIASAGAVIAAGSISTASAAVPSNKGLSIAGAVTGAVMIAAAVATIGVVAFSALGALISEIAEDFVVNAIVNATIDGEFAAADAMAESSSIETDMSWSGTFGVNVDASDDDVDSVALSDDVDEASAVSNANTSEMYKLLKPFAENGNEIHIRDNADLYSVWQPIGGKIKFFQQGAFIILNQARVTNEPIDLEAFAEYLEFDGAYESLPERFVALRDQLVGNVTQIDSEEAVKALTKGAGHVIQENQDAGKFTFWHRESESITAIHLLETLGTLYIETKNPNSILAAFEASDESEFHVFS